MSKELSILIKVRKNILENLEEMQTSEKLAQFLF